ncbi:MAG: SusC/RagA family TonB-linked outer membrane protein [Dysgonamonadaceae bacterium]|nr:SusC/RagA family TonB-linked outer membrane protein [Dysgonamonadaceae bacterium]
MTVIAIILSGFMHLYAQQNTVVRGKVSDAEGLPLPGVSVFEKDKDNRIVSGTVTDINGIFQIGVSIKADSLHFSMIGMKKVAKAVKGQTVVNVTMQEDEVTFSEVVVSAKRPVSTGGFLSQADRTAAMTTIKMEDFESIPAISIDQVLEGQVPGLMISMNSGDPGSGSAIQVRGASSVGLGTKPLIVVDNVPFKTEEVVDVNNPQGMSELLNISVNDIETINILKDAAATALWGSDGANGVIVITTKRGDSVKPRVNANASWGIKRPQSSLPLLNGDQYKTLILEAYQNRFGVGLDLLTSTIRNLFLEKGSLDYENYNNNTSWQDEINMKQGFTQDYSASIIGGGESAKYNVSLGYHDETGPVIETGFNRLNGRFNFDYSVSDNLNINSDISYSSSSKQSSYINNIGNLVIRKSPVLPVYTQDEYGNSLPSFFFPGNNGFQNDLQNPVAILKLAEAMDYVNRLDAKVQIRFSPVRNLQINGLVAATHEAITKDRFLPHSATGYDYYRENNMNFIINDNVNKADVDDLNSFTLYAKNDITYTLSKDEHSLVTGLYSIYEDISTKRIILTGTNLPSESLNNPYLSDILTTIGSEKNLIRSLSNVLQLYYSYSTRYALSGSIRRQGSSTFGKDHRFGYFPAISGFWRPISEPRFEKALKFFDEFKVRGSYGVTGRTPSNDILRRLGLTAINYFTYSANAPFIDMMGVTSDNIKLQDLRWEKTTSSNIGLDLGAFKNRLSFTGDVSFSTTKDLIVNAPLANTSGFEAMTRNFGTIRGRSFETAITGRPVVTDKWDLQLSFNITKTKSKVIELPNNEPVVQENALDNGKFLSLVNVGNEVGTIYGLKYLGVFSRDEDAFVKDAGGTFITNLHGEKVPIRWMKQDGEPFTGGDAIYADLNHDGIIDKQDVTIIGNNNPDFFGGFLVRLKYDKAWELFANFSYQYGFDIINVAKMNTTDMYTNNNQTQAVLRRWRKQGDITDVPRALYGAGHNFVGSDRYVEDGSYIKFNTLSLSYIFQHHTLARLKMRGAKIGFTVSNLGIWTKYSGVDPSINANRNDPFSLGKDEALTPIPITYSLQFWLNF